MPAVFTIMYRLERCLNEQGSLEPEPCEHALCHTCPRPDRQGIARKGRIHTKSTSLDIVNF